MNDKNTDKGAGGKPEDRQRFPTPSPPWFGGLILASLAIATAWTLTYTLAPLPGQRQLGGWNYAVVGLFLMLFVGLSMDWHGDPPEQ